MSSVYFNIHPAAAEVLLQHATRSRLFLQLLYFFTKTYVWTLVRIVSPNPMFDYLLESSHRDDSNKWSYIGYGEETVKYWRFKFILHVLSVAQHLHWCVPGSVAWPASPVAPVVTVPHLLVIPEVLVLQFLLILPLLLVVLLRGRGPAWSTAKRWRRGHTL